MADNGGHYDPRAQAMEEIHFDWRCIVCGMVALSPLHLEQQHLPGTESVYFDLDNTPWVKCNVSLDYIPEPASSIPIKKPPCCRDINIRGHGRCTPEIWRCTQAQERLKFWKEPRKVIKRHSFKIQF